MANNEHHSQRLQGAKEIIDKAHDLAKENGVSLDSCVWDERQEIVERVTHTLTITSGSKSSKGKFPDEWLISYPGKAGTEKVDLLLSEMIVALV